MTINIEEMLNGYRECALWASNDTDPATGEEIEGLEKYDGDIAPDALATMRKDCETFLARCVGVDLDTYVAERCSSSPGSGATASDLFGHDFWLTRNGHGTGFWDRDLGDLGDALTNLAHGMGECDMYIGDDGMLYVG